MKPMWERRGSSAAAQDKKSRPTQAAFFAKTVALSHCLDCCRETALVARCLVLVHNALVGDGVDHALGSLESLGSHFFVATGDGLAHGLDRGAQFRVQARIV